MFAFSLSASLFCWFVWLSGRTCAHVCLFVLLSVYLPARPSPALAFEFFCSVDVPICFVTCCRAAPLFVFVCSWSACLLVCCSGGLFFSLVWLSSCTFDCLFARLLVCVCVCLCVCLSVCLLVCLHACRLARVLARSLAHSLVRLFVCLFVVCAIVCCMVGWLVGLFG